MIVYQASKRQFIPDDMGVALEYTVPQTSKRIDVLLTGEDEAGLPKLVIIELKQWSEARFSEKDGIVWARRGGKAGARRVRLCVIDVITDQLASSLLAAFAGMLPSDRGRRRLIRRCRHLAPHVPLDDARKKRIKSLS